MTSPLTEGQREVTSRVNTLDGSNARCAQSEGREELDRVLQALGIPFDANLVQSRVTEWSEDGARGLMMPYADPRASSDRLNSLVTPAGWTRRYTVQASAPVQRSKRGPAAKILVTCEVTIACIGTNSGTGEDWSDKENALTAAEAQAFKRALSCFGLGRYLYDTDGEWIELDQHGVPKRIPNWSRGTVLARPPTPSGESSTRNTKSCFRGVLTVTMMAHPSKYRILSLTLRILLKKPWTPVRGCLRTATRLTGEKEASKARYPRAGVPVQLELNQAK